MRMENKGKVNSFMDGLDIKSRSIILHLLIKKHARINELSELINENDTLTLIKIRQIINPLAEEIFGKPILVFKESSIDLSEGKKVLFSWWLENDSEVAEEQKKELFDVFDEKNFVRLIMELHDAKNVDAEINGAELIVTAQGPNAKIRKEIPLNASVKKILEKTYKNGILEIKLEKEKGTEFCHISKQVAKS